MLKTLDLDTLLDLILFEDAETANARLEPYGLYAVILPDTNTDIKKIGTDEIMFSLARGDTGAFVDILVPDLEEKDVAGAELTTAQEDYEAEAPCMTNAEFYGVENYKSPFREAFPTGTQEWGKLGATLSDQILEERYRNLLEGKVAGSKLPSLLQFYAHGITESPIGRDIPGSRPTVDCPLSGKVELQENIEARIDPEALASIKLEQSKTQWRQQVNDGDTTAGFQDWLAFKDANDNLDRIQDAIDDILSKPLLSSDPNPYYSWPISDEVAAELPIVQKPFVESTSDERTVNNVMRHAYRVLNDDEKANMQKIKDMGLEFWNLIDSIGSDRELSNAKTRIEEAVMWAVRSITA